MGFIASGSVYGEMGHDGAGCEATHHMVDRKTGSVHRETNPPGCEGPLTVTPGTLVAEVGVGGSAS